MKQIEKGLETHFSKSTSEDSSMNQRDGSSTSSTNEVESTGNTFAKVNTVELLSPAQQAGLRVGDRIEKFGDADWLNNEKLSKVAQIVSQNEGVSQGNRIEIRSKLMDFAASNRGRRSPDRSHWQQLDSPPSCTYTKARMGWQRSTRLSFGS